MSRKTNPRIGSSFDDFLKESDLYGEVTSTAIKRSIVLKLKKLMESDNISISEMARRMSTSRTQLYRLLDPENDKIQLDTLFHAAKAVGKNLTVEIK